LFASALSCSIAPVWAAALPAQERHAEVRARHSRKDAVHDRSVMRYEKQAERLERSVSGVNPFPLAEETAGDGDA
jgi:hypothetical protein